jgi:hypothetical protein
MASHMNQQTFFQDPATLEQLELFDIVPDRPLPAPRFRDESGAEPHLDWLRNQSEDSLRILVQILENTPGFRRP